MLKWPDNVLLDDEQGAFGQTVLSFAKQELEPLAPEADSRSTLTARSFAVSPRLGCTVTSCQSSTAARARPLHGGHGLITGRPIDRIFRQARAPRMHEGTSEIQRLVIGRELVRGRA